MGALENLSFTDVRALPLADGPELRQALAEANVQTLLASYVHLTHDAAMLERFAEYIRPPYSIPGTEIPDSLTAELRAELLAVLTGVTEVRTERAPASLLQRIMSVTVGEAVEDEFVPLVLDQSGFQRPAPRIDQPGRPLPPSDFSVLVIGAGLTGMLAAIKLEEAGYKFAVIEKNPEVGGTWYENRYPGVGVDTPSHFYSYSFEIWPDWHHYHPHGRDMQDYLLQVADKYDARRHIQFNSKVTSLVYDQASHLWTVEVERADGTTDTLVANAVINCHGPVNRWKLPDIEGLGDFAGPVMHTAAWNPEVKVKGKRVAVIGTGASSAQLVGAIAPEVEDMAVFMRSKHWVIHNPEIANEVSEGMKFALRHIPHFKEWFRFRVYWFAADGLFANVLQDPEWKGNDLAVSASNDAMRQWALGYLHQKFSDKPELIERLTPDFPIFSKRIILDNGWCDALLRDNVHLKDTPIARIRADGIEMKDGSFYACDIIACATGFNVAKMIGNLTIKGVGGRDLGEEWGQDDPRSYLGMTIPGYPNYFHTTGPNSAPNHAAGQNLVSECQINYIIEALDRVVAAGARAFEVRQEAYDAWNRKVEERMPQMIWTHPRANSYYNNSKGRVFLSWPWRLVDYFSVTREPEEGSYLLHG